MNNEYFWSISLEPGWVQAGIWTLEDEQVSIAATSPPMKWESEEDLVQVVDSALSAAVQDFPEEAKEPSKTVFGVRPNWVEEGKIKKEHLGKIREICSKLSLSPTGFVVLPEAIAHASKVKDGSPLTGVLIGISEEEVDVTIFRLGNLVGTVTVAKSVSLVDDVVEGLTRFNGAENIPTRFLVYNGNSGELGDAKQALVNADWPEVTKGKVKLLHTPQIEVVDPIDKTNAVSIAGASEMGEVKGVMGNVVDKDGPMNAMGEDESNVKPAEGVKPQDFGFVVDGEGEAQSESDSEPKEKKKLPFSLPSFSFLKRGPKTGEKRSFKPKISKMSISGESKLKRTVIGLVIFLVIAVVGLGVAWWYLPKADVVIFIAPKTLEQVESLTLESGRDSADVENHIFPATVLSTDIEGDKTVSATGTRRVGDKAKGKVKIRNGTSTGIKVSAGTILTGPNNLKFVVDNDASVSAKISVTEPGETVVDATADDIGAEYNLASGEELTVANISKSEVDAVVDSEFTGGSSRDVVAVSQSDVDKLEADLKKELTKQGTDKLEGQSASDAVFIPDAVTVSVKNKSFSDDVGAEANSVSLTMSLQVDGLTIPKDTVDSFVQGVMADQVPDGFKLKSEQVQTNFVLVKKVKDGVWDFDVSIQANLLPETNPDDIKRAVAGKYPTQAQSYLSSIPGYTGAEVRIKPRFPGRLGNIPRVLNHISIEIVADK